VAPRFGLVQQEQRRHLASSPGTGPPDAQPSCGGRLSVPAQNSEQKKNLNVEVKMG